MIVPVQETNIPEALDEQEIATCLTRLALGELPAFVIRNAWQTHTEAVSALTPSLREQGFNRPSSTRTFANQYPQTRLRGLLTCVVRPTVRTGFNGDLHTDHASKKGAPTHEITVHTTVVGQVKAHFYEPTPEYARKFSEQARLKRIFEILKNPNIIDTLYLPNEVYQQLAEDTVDSQILSPYRHTVKAEEETTIVFRSGGLLPLFHKFDAMTLPRRSTGSAFIR
jgi:hypothetical protein